MPLYDYQCRDCHHAFEALVRPPTAPACPECASSDLERMVSSCAFAVRSGGLSNAARRAVQKQQAGQRRDHAAYQQESEKKHFDDD